MPAFLADELQNLVFQIRIGNAGFVVTHAAYEKAFADGKAGRQGIEEMGFVRVVIEPVARRVG